MNHFCTYCDRGYAARLLCLHDSLAAQGEPFRLHVLCFDAETEAVIAGAAQPSLRAISLESLLQADPAYAAVRGLRTPVEFYFTATPVLVRHCLQLEPTAAQMTYLDADLYFFGPPSRVFAEQGAASVGIVSHRFPAHLAERAQYGTYNVAWVSFRRDHDGLACLEWWREQCLEWCQDRVEAGRFADQGYLDEFPRRFAGVRVLDHPGINAAPWNMAGVTIKSQGQALLVNDQPLLFYHFQGLREVLPGWFETGLSAYGTELTPALRDLIYLPYLKKLTTAQAGLRRRFGPGHTQVQPRQHTGQDWRDHWERFKNQWLRPQYRRLRGRLLHCPEPGAPV